jgi:hypothetical protein
MCPTAKPGAIKMKWLFPLILASGVYFGAGMAAANDTINPKTATPRVLYDGLAPLV